MATLPDNLQAPLTDEAEEQMRWLMAGFERDNLALCAAVQALYTDNCLTRNYVAEDLARAFRGPTNAEQTTG